MRNGKFGAALVVGAVVGVAGSVFWGQPPRTAHASSNDRYQDYIMCTGAVSVNPKAPTDGVWLLDYRGGKLLGTVIDRLTGKINGWAEVDLVEQFGIAPKTDVHFMMTTGSIAQGQAALYVSEVATGKFGVYTMGANVDGGIVIRRHDISAFRVPKGG